MIDDRIQDCHLASVFISCVQSLNKWLLYVTIKYFQSESECNADANNNGCNWAIKYMSLVDVLIANNGKFELHGYYLSSMHSRKNSWLKPNEAKICLI